MDDTTDTHLRKEFARAFGWYKNRGNFSGYGEDEPMTPTWEKIFTEIGSLLNQAHRLSDEYRFSGLENRLDELERNIRAEIHPNLPASTINRKLP